MNVNGNTNKLGMIPGIEVLIVDLDVGPKNTPGGRHTRRAGHQANERKKERHLIKNYLIGERERELLLLMAFFFVLWLHKRFCFIGVQKNCG